MNLQDKELLNELVLESRDHLTAIEPDLLALEQGGASVTGDIVNRIFRAVHSIKGGFSFFGIEKVTRLAHTMENVMVRIRDQQLAISPECVDALLLGVDKLRALLDDAAHSDKVAIDAECARLAPFLGNQAVPAAPEAMPLPSVDREVHARHPDISMERLFDALKHGKQVYEVSLNSQTDLVARNLSPLTLLEEWEKVGEVMDVAIDTAVVKGLAGSSRKNVPYSILFSSVLEPDLISAAVGVPESQIQALDMAQVKQAFKAAHPVVAAPDTGAKGGGAKPAAAESAHDRLAGDSKIEEALRVRVGLLNNLMNLAGELVLSRNQLMQCVNRRLSESFSSESFFRDLGRTLEHSFSLALESARGKKGDTDRIVSAEIEKIKTTFQQSMNVRLVDLQGLRSIFQSIDLVTSMLQENIMQTRLQPISIVFSKFPRVIRDLAKKCGKEANLTIIGQDVELDKSIVELLSDPLTHLIRNAMDHGIERPEARVAAGKEPVGQVVLRAYHEGGKVNIEIQDDGGGINTEQVRKKAIEKNLVTAEAAGRLTDLEVHQFIMAPGFSTAEIVSDVSGRGVGMDVVKTNIEKLGGVLEITSTPGEGTRFTMRLPLTLAIISSLIVTVEKQRFAVPQVNIEELVRIRSKDITKKIEMVGGAEVFRLRNHLLPLVRLATVLGVTPVYREAKDEEWKPDKRNRWSDRRGVPDEGNASAPGPERRASGADRRSNVYNAVKIVVLRTGENRFGLVVDEVFDSEEIVVKPLSGYLKSCTCYAGSTIMGDGSVSMILDANGLARHAQLNFTAIESENAKERARLEQSAASSKKLEDMLLFNLGSSERFAIRLADVARVEKIAVSTIQKVSNKEYLTNDKTSLRLVRLEQYLPISRAESVSENLYIIVPKKTPQPLGIATAAVQDVIHSEVIVDTRTVRGKGILGSSVIGSHLTLLLDLPAIFDCVEQEG